MAALGMAAATQAPDSDVRLMLSVPSVLSQSSTRLLYKQCPLLRLHVSALSSTLSSLLLPLELKTLPNWGFYTGKTQRAEHQRTLPPSLTTAGSDTSNVRDHTNVTLEQVSVLG